MRFVHQHGPVVPCGDVQCRALLEHGNKRTPLHLAAQWNHVGPLQATHTIAPCGFLMLLVSLQDLASLGFLETGDSDGTRPLHLAARSGGPGPWQHSAVCSLRRRFGHEEAVKALLGEGLLGVKMPSLQSCRQLLCAENGRPCRTRCRRSCQDRVALQDMRKLCICVSKSQRASGHELSQGLAAHPCTGRR